MNLYLISQDSNRDYDTYDSAVVAAVNEKDASVMHPYGRKKRQARQNQRSALI